MIFFLFHRGEETLAGPVSHALGRVELLARPAFRRRRRVSPGVLGAGRLTALGEGAERHQSVVVFPKLRGAERRHPLNTHGGVVIVLHQGR